MVYRMTPFLMTLSDFQGHAPTASPLRCVFFRTVVQQLRGFQLTELLVFNVLAHLYRSHCRS